MSPPAPSSSSSRVHDTTTGSTIRLGAHGTTEWAPATDQLVVDSDDGALAIVTLPSLTRVPLETEGGNFHARWDLHGIAVAVRSYGDPDRFQHPLVTVYEASSGRRLARWEGFADGFARHFVRFADGLLGIVLTPSEDCQTFRLYSPLLPEDGRCIDGHNPRLSPDGRSIAYFTGVPDATMPLALYDISTNEARTIGTLQVSGEVPLARWNANGTHLFIQRHWSGVGFSDELP